MENKRNVRKTISIDAPISEVWEALIDPGILKQTMFGCDVVTRWEIGGEILFKGSWEGNEFVDKGTIKDFQEGKSYEYDYWSNFSGLPDIPENYSTVRFELEASGAETVLRLEQRNLATPTMYEHSDKNWDVALNTLKVLIEKNNPSQDG